MLVKICLKDNVPLVNVVRKDEHVELLKGIGAQHALNSMSSDFMADLVAVLTETDATLGFDATGGGVLASTPPPVASNPRVASVSVNTATKSAIKSEDIEFSACWAPMPFSNSTCSSFRTTLTSGTLSFRQIFTNIWPDVGKDLPERQCAARQCRPKR